MAGNDKSYPKPGSDVCSRRIYKNLKKLINGYDFRTSPHFHLSTFKLRLIVEISVELMGNEPIHVKIKFTKCYPDH